MPSPPTDKHEYRIVLSKTYPSLASDYPVKDCHFLYPKDICSLEEYNANIWFGVEPCFAKILRNYIIKVLSQDSTKLYLGFEYPLKSNFYPEVFFLSEVFKGLLDALDMPKDIFNKKFYTINLSWDARIKIQKLISQK